MGDELENVEPGDVLRGEELGGLAAWLLEDGGQDVTGLHFRPLRALNVQHGHLQHTLEGRGLLGLTFIALF